LFEKCGNCHVGSQTLTVAAGNLTMFKKSVIVLMVVMTLGAAVLTWPPHAWALDLGKLLDNIESDNVKSIDVVSLVALMADKNSRVFVYDVDPVSDREKMGVIPGALVLSSWNKFDLATELPKDKNAKLVFYCHNWL
jgi:hypothetical protein